MLLEFDQSKYYLGKVCKRGHDWNETGFSLRYKDNHCVACQGSPKKFAGQSSYTEKRFWEKVEVGADNECWNWTGCRGSQGYGKFWDGKHTSSHRYSFELHHYKIPDGCLVLHSCDNPSCVNPKHLSVGTYQDNADDCVQKNRTIKGSLNSQSKLTENQVREIRQIYAKGNTSQTILAKQFGVSQPLIGIVVRKESWKHIL